MDGEVEARVNETLARAGLAIALLLILALVARKRARRRHEFEPRHARIPDALAQTLRAPLTAFYFTSRLCSECRDTPRVVQEAAPEVPLIALPVEGHGALARELGVTETPTLLIVDAQGRIRYARAGNPPPIELWTHIREAWDSLDAEGGLTRQASPLT